MKSFRPLRLSGSDAERLLLDAGASERPDPARIRSAARSLGLFQWVLTIIAGIVIATRAAKWSTIAAWGLVPLVGVVAVGFAARAVERPVSAVVARPAAPTEAVRPPMPTPAARGDGPPAPSLASPGAVAEASREQPVHDAPAVRAASRPKPTSVVAAAATGLRDQAGVLDRVRVLVAAGDTGTALTELDDFDRRFAGGPLSEESLILRIEALARRGDRSTAAALAKTFLRAHPTSVHVDRVTALAQQLATP